MGRRSRGGALAVLVILLANVLTLAAAPEEVQPDREGAGGARWAEGDVKRASGDDARGARGFSPVDPRRIACATPDVDDADATRYLAALDLDIGTLDPPFHPLTLEYVLSIAPNALAPRSAPGDASASPHAPAAFLGVRALACDPEADIAVGNTRARREVTHRPMPGGAFDVLEAAPSDVASKANVVRVPLARGGNVVRIAVHVGHDDEDAEVDARTVYTVHARVVTDADEDEDEAFDAQLDDAERDGTNDDESSRLRELARARSVASETALERAGWTVAASPLGSAPSAPPPGTPPGFVAIGSVAARADAFPGVVSVVDAPGPASFPGGESPGGREWTLEIVAVPRGGTTRLLREDLDGTSTGPAGARVRGPVAVRMGSETDRARFSFRLDAKRPPGKMGAGSSLSLLYRACVVGDDACRDAPPRRIALDVAATPPAPPPALVASVSRGSPRPFSIPRPFSTPGDSPPGNVSPPGSSRARRWLELTSLPSRGTLVLCGVDDGEDGDHPRSGSRPSLSFAVIDRPRVIAGDEFGTPARVAYVPARADARRGSLETRARAACESGHGPPATPIPAGPRARKAAARRALLGDGVAAGVDDARRRLSPPATTTDGFTYRFVSEGLPSPSVPVTVYVVDDDDDDDPTNISTNISTPAVTTRRLLAERISPSTASTSSVGSAVTVTVPAASASSPTCVEVAIGDAVDDWTCALSVQPEDRKLGHAGPITCRKPTYEVTIVPVSGGNPGCVVVGATYDAGGSCPLDGVGDDASRLRGLSASSASIPATLVRLSACAADATLTVWARSTCAVDVQLTVNAVRAPASADTGSHPRKRLADCLHVPPSTLYVCPEDPTTPPRPASCPSSVASGEGDVLVTLPVTVTSTPVGVDVPGALTIRREVFTAPHPDNALVYQYEASDGSRGSRFLSFDEGHEGAAVEVTDPGGRVIVTPTPRGGAAGGRSWPGSPAAMLRYVACVVEDGTCANGGVAEIDVSARPRVFVNDVLTTTKGAISEAFRLDARDSDGDSLLYVVTSLPADLRTKGTTRFCADGDPDTLTCKGSPYSLTQSCVGDCLILCSAGAQCVSCVESNQLVCPGSQTPARNPLIYYTPLTCEECGGRPVGSIQFKVYDGAQFSTPVSEPGAQIDFHVNAIPVATSAAAPVGLLDRIPADCDAECAADCAAVCARSCAEYREQHTGVAAGVCEANNLSGECDAATCEAACTVARCESGYGFAYQLTGTDVDDDVLSFSVIGVPFYVRDNGDGTTTNVPLGKVYQTAPGNVNQIISPDQNPAAEGDWGAVADSNGVIRYVPAKDSHGRPYGGSINGAITFRVFDGFSLSDNFGEVTFAVDTPPTATAVHSTVNEGGSLVMALAVADPVDCPSGQCGRLSDGTFSGAVKAIITRVAPAGGPPGLFIHPPDDTPTATPVELRCDGEDGACDPPLDVGRVPLKILYVPPPAVNPSSSLAPRGTESTRGVITVEYVADDGALRSTAVASTITFVPKPRADDVVIRVTPLAPKTLVPATRVPVSEMEYYSDVTVGYVRVSLPPTDATLSFCGDQNVADADRVHTMLYSLQPNTEGELWSLQAPSGGAFYDSNGNLIDEDEPTPGAQYVTSLSSMQVNPSYFGQQVEKRVDNEPRQVLFLPKAPAHGAPGYNTSFQFRVCVTEASGNSRVCDPDKYSDIATATVVVLPHNLPPVAVAPPTPPTLREDFDAVEGVLITLGGSDPEGATTQAQIVIPPGFAISCGDNSDKCGSLWQVDFITGKATTRIDPNECDLNTPCPVTDPLSRVRFIPNLGGHDPAGPNGAPYVTFTYVVTDGVMLSMPVEVSVRVNAAPVIPSAIRRVFVDEDSSGILPVNMLASDSDGDELTVQFIELPGAYGKPEFFHVESGAKGAPMDSGRLPVSNRPGSLQVWFEPPYNTSGDKFGCCLHRECPTEILRLNPTTQQYLQSTCQECSMCATVNTACECDYNCCPQRHFYGKIVYGVKDSFGMRSKTNGEIHVYVRPAPSAPLVMPDYTVVAYEGTPTEIDLHAADNDRFCYEENVTYVSGYTVIPAAFPGLPDTVVTQYDWKYEVKCNEEVLSAVLVDAPLEDEGLGTLSTPDGVPPGNLYKVQQAYEAYVQFPEAWFGPDSGHPQGISRTEAVAEGRAMWLMGTTKVVYTPPPIAAGYPFVTLRFGIRDTTTKYSPRTTRVRVVVRHKLDDRLSRFVRLPNWYFRDISTSKLANETVDWWLYPYGFNPDFIPEGLQDGTHWLTPKRRDEMGAFLMPGGRNDIGQLGLGHAMNLRTPRLNDDADVKPLELERLSAGERSTLGISMAPGNSSRGNVYSWGDGAHGRLGHGDVYPRTSPTLVRGLAGKNISRVAAFSGHAAAVTATGELYTWGSDSDGQLGRPRRPGSLRGPAAEAFDPVVKASTEPMKIHRVTAGGLDRHDVIDAAVGDAHTLALTADGTLWAWGSNRAGQLGRLDCAERSHHPKGQPRLANASDPDSPVVFGGYEKGNGTGCEAYGAPATGRIATPGPLELSLRFRPYRGHPMERLRVRDMDLEPVKFRAVAAAASYTVAIRADPAPGTPEAAAIERRREAVLDKPPPLDLISDPIDMGDEEYTAAAATAGGQVYTWGYGDVGQLGHGLGFVPVGIDNVGQRVMVPTPVRALEGVDAVRVSASRYHALAVSRDGRVYTWGSGLYGQLGHGDRYPRFEPTLVAALVRVNITDAVAGTRHTVAVCDLGEVYAWGSNEFGELGVDPRPVKPNEGMANPTLTLRGWLFGDAPTPSYANPPPPTESPAAPSGKKRRSVLGMDTEEDPTGKFDVIFERLRDDVDESGRSGMTHASFGALIAGVQPAIPPPWENVNGTLDELVNQRFGSMLGQSRDSAGVVEYLTLPRLVRGLAQVSEVAAGDGFTLAVRKACRPGTYLDPDTGACVDCAPGTYSDVLSSLECTPCPRGQAATAAGSSRCTPCDPGHYADAPGTEQCVDCPAGTFVGFGGAASAEQCVPCSPGTFADAPGAAKCEPCGAGTYQELSRQIACVPCPASTYLPGTAARSRYDCLSCPSGTFGAGSGAASCDPCAAGTYTETPGSAFCWPCPVGTYGEGEGNTACESCPAGTYGEKLAAEKAGECPPCPAGNFSDSLGATACGACPAGTFSDVDGSTECVDCPPGTYGVEEGADSIDQCLDCPIGQYNPGSGKAAEIDDYGFLTECFPCAMGTFANATGLQECFQCPPGTHLNKTGSIRESDCYDCDYGTFAPVGGMDECLLCPPGTYMNDRGATECTGCDPGFFNDDFGSGNLTSCRPCPPGTYSDVVGTGNCMLCPEGEYNPNYAQTECTKCPQGFYLPVKNSTEESACLPCPLGTYSNVPGLGLCLECPPGSFSEKEQAIECELCAAGTVYGLPGGNSSLQCDACFPGTHAPVPGMPECLPCPAGSYNELDKATECTPCDPGLYLPFEGSKNAEDCVPCQTNPVGTFAAEPGTAECAPCPVGTYADEEGLEECKKVPEGSYLDKSGSNSSDARTLCPIGTFAADPGAAICTDCPTGSYAENEGSVLCTMCEPGYFLPIEKATSRNQCRRCTKGTRSAAGAGQCILCPPGQYGDKEAMPECIMCPPGTFNPNAGEESSAACIDCAIGYHNEFPGKALCLPCPAGTYGNLTGMPECWKCEPGTFISVEGSIFPSDCALCPMGTYSDQHGAGKCTQCPPGTFNSYEGQDVCTLCPARTYGPESGAKSIELCEYCPRWHFNTTPGSSRVEDCVYHHSPAAGVFTRFAVWFAVVLACVAVAALDDRDYSIYR